MASSIVRKKSPFVRGNWGFVIGGLLCCTVLLAHAQQAKLVLEVGAWPPYIDFSTPHKGALSKMVLDAFSAAGVTAQVKEVSWKAAEHRVSDGRSVSFGWIKNPERVVRWRYSHPICIGTSFLVSRRAAPVRWDTLEDLKGIKMGWSRGYSYGAKFDALRPDVQVFEMANDEVGLRRLLLGSVDAMPMDSLVVKELLEQKFSKAEGEELHLDLRPAHAISRADLHLVCDLRSSDCTKTVALFNQGLSKRRKSQAVGSCAAE